MYQVKVCIHEDFLSKINPFALGVGRPREDRRDGGNCHKVQIQVPWKYFFNSSVDI